MKYVTKLTKMKDEYRNIPFNKAEMDSLPYGFTETSVMPTKNFDSRASKYLPQQKPKFEKNG